MSYKHLSLEERYQIKILLDMGYNASAIAIMLKRNKSSILREISRNRGGRGYRPGQANQLAQSRQKVGRIAPKIAGEVAALISNKLKLKWSPVQISGWLKVTHDTNVSHESIYKYVLKDKKENGPLYLNLRHQRKRKKRYGTKSHDRRGQIKNKVSIDDRPAIVNSKSRIGDWEGDLVIGKNHKYALVTLAERKSKRVKILKVTSKESIIVTNAICQMLKNEKVHTITFDNGKEFSGHEQIASKLGVNVYFAHPYSSWERGLNENTNGLIRQYFPKGSCFKGITSQDVIDVEKALNDRPRKGLGFMTPNQIYSGKRKYQFRI